MKKFYNLCLIILRNRCISNINFNSSRVRLSNRPVNFSYMNIDFFVIRTFIYLMEKINFKRKYFNFEPSQIIDENNNNESILSTVCMKIYKSNDKINIIEYFESLKMILLNNIDLKILETFEKYNIIDIFIKTFLNQEYLIDFIYNFIAICSAHEDEVSQYLISKNFLTFAKNDFNRVKNKNDIICLLSNICGCSVECRNAVLDAFSLEHLCSLFLSDSSLRNNLNVLFMNLTKFLQVKHNYYFVEC